MDKLIKHTAKISLVLLSLALSGCWFGNNDPEPQLQLPEPSQVGANNAGCNLNGNLWISETKPKLEYTSGEFKIQMYGEVKTAKDKTLGDATITFILKNSEIQHFDSLLLLNGKNIRLYGRNGIAKVQMKVDNQTSTCEALTGTLVFDKVEKKTSTSISNWNDQVEWYLLAGTFELDKNQNCSGLEIKNGRFDFAVDQYSFE